jgi:hypothetical protein
VNKSNKFALRPAIRSMGDSDDNALAATINGLCKAEWIHRGRPGGPPQFVNLCSPQLANVTSASDFIISSLIGKHALVSQSNSAIKLCSIICLGTASH